GSRSEGTASVPWRAHLSGADKKPREGAEVWIGQPGWLRLRSEGKIGKTTHQLAQGNRYRHRLQGPADACVDPVAKGEVGRPRLTPDVEVLGCAAEHLMIVGGGSEHPHQQRAGRNLLATEDGIGG